VLEIATATCSERGQRDSNEDLVRVARLGSRCLAILADGAGGHEGGAEASRRAVQGVEAALAGAGIEFGAPALTRAVRAAHAQVQHAQRHAEALGRMHSTVVTLWIDAQRAAVLWSHVGDSRLYRARHGIVELLTADDSVVQRMVDAGLLTPQQAEVHPQKNQLIAALGVEDELHPHTLERPAALEEGDAFLLCSDGWWGALDDADVAQALEEADTPADWLGRMRRRIEARDRPKQDNFSAIAVWADDPTETTRPMAFSEEE